MLNSDNVDLNPLLPQAFKAMEDRPVLFKYSLDEYIMARRNNIVRSFIDALTRGGPSGVPKPIELLSHDPLRYVGDMYAWIHQALMNEKDLLIALFKQCAAEESKKLKHSKNPGFQIFRRKNFTDFCSNKVNKIKNAEENKIFMLKKFRVSNFQKGIEGLKIFHF